MRLPCWGVLIAAAILLAGCNKSSPPPQEPVKPRNIAQVETPLRLPAP
jgi:hypothetical protein